MADVESLELKVTSTAEDAERGLDALIGTLGRLGDATKGGCGLNAIVNPLRKIAAEAGKLNGTEGDKIKSLASGLQALSGLGNLKLSASIANQISAIAGATKSLDGVDYSGLGNIANAMQPLMSLGKSNLGSVLNQIKKLPEIVAELNKVDMTAFSSKIKQLADGLKPLANQMQKVANGFAAFPNKIQKFVSASNKMQASNAKSTSSFVGLAAKFTAFAYATKRIAGAVASWIHESNDYIENVNLFSVSMGEYAESAFEYAEKVRDAMGINISEWVRNQGVFMTLATGFGIVGDKAAIMSQQLTQLGYDISSYYNITVEEAMQKLKSGFSGELEPLRNLGYDLSQAKLEAIALSLGIDKSVSSMTQAEKAVLRYHAIMTQVTWVQGDLARTLNEPANQLRVLSAQAREAARAFGNLFIPALNAILPAAIAAVKVITILAQAVASLFGITLSVDFARAGSSMAGVGSSAADTADSINDAAGGAAKLKKILLGIDELNVLPEESSGGGGGVGGGVGGASFDYEPYEYTFLDTAVSKRIDEITEKIKEWLGITDDIDSWSELMDTRLGTILKTVGLIGAGLAAWKLSTATLAAINAIKGILASPFHTITIGATLAITGFTLAFDGMEDAIENGLDGFNFTQILTNDLVATGGSAMVGSVISSWILKTFSGSAIAKALTTAGTNLGSTLVMNASGEFALASTGAIGAALGAAAAAIIVGLPTYFTALFDAIKNGLDWLSGVLIPVGSTLAATGIGTVIGVAVGSIGGPLGALVGAVIGLLVGLWTDIILLVTQNWNEISAWLTEALSTIGQFFADLWQSIKDIWNTVAEWFNTNVIIPVVGFFSGLWFSVSSFFVNLWADIVAIFAVVAEWFNTNVIIPVIGFFEWLWGGVVGLAEECWNRIVDKWSPVVEWFSKLFESVFQTLQDIFYNIGVIAVGCWNIIEVAWGIASTWFNTNVIQPIGNFFTNLWAGIVNAARNAWTTIQTLYAAGANWLNVNVIQPIGNFFTNLWSGVKNVASDAWNGIKDVARGVSNWYSNEFIPNLKADFNYLWSELKRGAKDAWAGVKETFSSVATFFRDTFERAWAGVVNVFSVAGEIFVDIKDGVTAAFKSIVNSLIRGLNRVITEPFQAINRALLKIKNIEILGITPFSGIKTISIPSIPLLASGGMVNNGQMFVAREAGPELVGTIGNRSAVVNNDQIVESVAQGVYRAVVSAMAESGGNQVVEAKVNDKVLFEVVVGRNRQETMRMGYNPLLGGV